MKKIRISLFNGDIVDVPCSVLFVKHIEGTVCMPEEAINHKLSPDNTDVFQQNETEEGVDLYTYNTLPYPYIHVINFHQKDLPFTYSSVDVYGRGIIDFALSKSTSEKPIAAVATAVHGPGAGLDASEAMERLLMAVAAELYKRANEGHLEEFIFVERNKAVFERLRERLEFLVRQNILVHEGGKTFLLPNAVKAQQKKENQPKLKLKEKHVFVAMPFDKNFDDVYLYGIKKAVEKNSRVSERTDQEFFTGDIIQR
ncbi:MAG TPA: hypothetical protein VM871_04210, partial [Flavisolibacter sp.]|nr:hypothetical protein [Flavisolibacter sp.]